MPKKGTQVNPTLRAWAPADAAAIRAGVEAIYGPAGSQLAMLRAPVSPEVRSESDRDAVRRWEVDRVWLDELIDRGVPTPRAQYPKPGR